MLTYQAFCLAFDDEIIFPITLKIDCTSAIKLSGFG
jgi:hypothetical protein